jgi:hypothetical protein
MRGRVAPGLLFHSDIVLTGHLFRDLGTQSVPHLPMCHDDQFFGLSRPRPPESWYLDRLAMDAELAESKAMLTVLKREYVLPFI